MSKELGQKQIEEMAGFIYGLPMCTKDDCDFVAKLLIGEGYRKQSDVIRCKDCNYFMEYSSEYSRTTEKADGDCHIRLMNSENRQFCACRHDDFCSFAKMKGGAE